MEPMVELSDEELLNLSKQWEKESSDYHNYLKQIQDTNERYYLGDPTTAYNVMRFLSLGIKNNDLRKI